MTDEEREQAGRELVRKLFNAPPPVPYEDLAERPALPTGNYVPREGTNGEPARPRDYDERDAVGELFGTDLNLRNLSYDPVEPPRIHRLNVYPSTS